MSSDRSESAQSKSEREAMTSKSDASSSELFRVGVRIPPFWPEKPLIWFSQIEGQFNMARISDDLTKFHYVLSHLDRQYSIEVEDIITNPPASGKYEKLKTELIKRLSVSKEKKVKQLLLSEELGDRKPSQFLRHLQHLAGPTIPDDFLRTIWTSRLPSNLQTVIASQLSLTLTELADLADRVHDIAPASPQVAAASSSRPEDLMEVMARQISELTSQVSALTAVVNRRSRSRNRDYHHRRSRTPSRRSESNFKKFPLCWYHFKFGNHAKKCILPCDFKSENTQGSR